MGRKKKEKTITIALRIPQTTNTVLSTMAKDIGFSKSKLINLFIENLLSKSNMTFGNINLKEIAQLRKQKELRELIKFKRNEEMSKILFESRLKKDIFKLFVHNATYKDIKKIINIYYEESCQYLDCNELNKKLQNYRTFEEKDYNKMKVEIIKTLPLPKIKFDNYQHERNKHKKASI